MPLQAADRPDWLNGATANQRPPQPSSSGTDQQDFLEEHCSFLPPPVSQKVNGAPAFATQEAPKPHFLSAAAYGRLDSMSLLIPWQSGHPVSQ